MWCSQNPVGVYSKSLLFFMILPGPASSFQTFVHSHLGGDEANWIGYAVSNAK